MSTAPRMRTGREEAVGLAATLKPPTLQVLHLKGLECDKPLVAAFFAYAYEIAAGSRATAAPRPPASPTPHTGEVPSPPRGRERAAALVRHASPPPALAPVCPSMLQLTPSTMEKERRSARSGRVYSESESLHAKHADEYDFLIPILDHAFVETITVHDRIRTEQAHYRSGLHVPTPSSAVTVGNAAGEDLSEASAGAESTMSATLSEEDEDELHATPAGRRSRGTSQRRVSRGALAVGPASLAGFYRPRTSSMPVHDFLRRIVKYTFSSPTSLVAACYYMDKLLATHPSLLLTLENFHALFLTATRVASKFFDTRTLNNKDFALVGDMSNKELNSLEVTFLQSLDCVLYIAPEEFYSYAFDLVNAALGGRRGQTTLPPAHQHRATTGYAVAMARLTGAATGDAETSTGRSPPLDAEDARPAAGAPVLSMSEPSPVTPQPRGANASSSFLDTRVVRGSRRPSIAGLSTSYMDRRTRSLSLASNASQSGVLLPALRSASRPALPPAVEASVELASLRQSSNGLESGSRADGAVVGEVGDAPPQGLVRILRVSEEGVNKEAEEGEGAAARPSTTATVDAGLDPRPPAGTEPHRSGAGARHPRPPLGAVGTAAPSASTATTDTTTAAATAGAAVGGPTGPENSRGEERKLAAPRPPSVIPTKTATVTITTAATAAVESPVGWPRRAFGQQYSRSTAVAAAPPPRAALPVPGPPSSMMVPSRGRPDGSGSASSAAGSGHALGTSAATAAAKAEAPASPAVHARAQLQPPTPSLNQSYRLRHTASPTSSACSGDSAGQSGVSGGAVASSSAVARQPPPRCSRGATTVPWSASTNRRSSLVYRQQPGGVPVVGSGTHGLQLHNTKSVAGAAAAGGEGLSKAPQQQQQQQQQS